MYNSSRNKRLIAKSLAVAILTCCSIVNAEEGKQNDSSNADLSRSLKGKWQGSFEHPKWRFKALMELEQTSVPDELTGQIAWTMLRSPAPEEQRSKIGKTAVEHVSGKFDRKTRQLVLTGQSIDDPHQVGIALDKYRLTLSPDGNALSGGTEAHSDGLGKFSARRIVKKVKPSAQH